jgi:hypothetical protein
MMLNKLPTYQKIGVIVTVASLLAIAQPAQAATLIGNDASLGTASDMGLSVERKAVTTIFRFDPEEKIDELTIKRAYVSFTVPQQYSLNTISLRLAGFNFIGNVKPLKILSDPNAASVDPSGAVVAFQDFRNPIPIGNADSNIGTFNFNPNTPFVFEGGTKYWLSLSEDVRVNVSINWVGSGTPGIEPSGIANFNSYVSYTFFQRTETNFPRSSRVISESSSYSTSSLNPSFNIDVTPVPFEFNPTLGLGAIGGFWLVRKGLKKKSTKV